MEREEIKRGIESDKDVWGGGARKNEREREREGSGFKEVRQSTGDGNWKRRADAGAILTDHEVRSSKSDPRRRAIRARPRRPSFGLQHDVNRPGAPERPIGIHS